MARSASSSASLAAAAEASSGCSARPAGSAIAQPLDRASSRRRALPPGAGTKIAASASAALRASGLTRERTRARSRSLAGIAGRRVRCAVRASTISQPGRAGRSRSIVLATALWPGASSTTITLRFVAGANTVEFDAERDRPCSRRGTAPTRGRSRLRRYRAARRRGRGAWRAGSCAAARRCARWRGTSQPSSSAPRASAAEERLDRPGSKPCTTSNDPSESTLARFARTPTGSATRSVSEAGTAAPIATTSPTTPRCRARRPSSRSAARDEGATIVTTCPRRRSAAATPPTCSFTSCGCDQENGVTKQMRRAMAGGF